MQHGDRQLLKEQLELLKTKKVEVDALLASGGEVDQALADDLVGIVFVIRAALLSGSLSGVEREEVERSERTARELLRSALRNPR